MLPEERVLNAVQNREIALAAFPCILSVVLMSLSYYFLMPFWPGHKAKIKSRFAAFYLLHRWGKPDNHYFCNSLHDFYNFYRHA